MTVDRTTDAMIDPFDTLIRNSTRAVPGREANQALWDVRRELEETYGSALLYEIVAREDMDWLDFLSTIVPRATEHLEAKGMSMLGGPSARIALWRGATMYVFESRSFFAGIQEVEGLDDERLWRRIAEWRQAAGLSVPPEAAKLPRNEGGIPKERALTALRSKDPEPD